MKTKKEILEYLSFYKKEFQEKTDFTILGIFGSYARDEGDENSDIDILYKIEDIKNYLSKYNGWEAINHIVETKKNLSKLLDRDIDFVDIESLNSIGREYILKDLKYV